MKKSILVAQSGMYYILKSGTFKEWTNTYQDLHNVLKSVSFTATVAPKFSGTLTLSQIGRTDYAQSLALPHLEKFHDYAPDEYCLELR